MLQQIQDHLDIFDYEDYNCEEDFLVSEDEIRELLLCQEDETGEVE